MKFIFDGTDMYVVSTRESGMLTTSREFRNISYTRLQRIGNTTEKG